MAMATVLFGASTVGHATFTQLVQINTRRVSLVPSVEREGVASKTLKPESHQKDKLQNKHL